MRKYIIAGNWKMFKTRGEAINFLLQVADKVPSSDLVDSVVCTQAPILRDCVKRQGDNLKVGAQNMEWRMRVEEVGIGASSFFLRAHEGELVADEFEGMVAVEQSGPEAHLPTHAPTCGGVAAVDERCLGCLCQ